MQLISRLLFGLLTLGVAYSQPNVEVPAEEFPSSATLVRGDKKIEVVKYGPNSAGIFEICLPRDNDRNKVTRSVIYDAAPYFVHITIDKNVIKTRVAYLQQTENGDGELEAFDGSATRRNEDDPECLPAIKREPKPKTVFVDQGKTKLSGSLLRYSQETGIAVIEGPITFERPQTGGSVLRGSSQKITVDVDNEQTFLEGNVTLESKCRTSSATRVEYDDRENRAVLYGNPAISKRLDGSDEIKAERIEYNLETNDVTLEGNISGVIDDAAKPCNESGS